MNRDGWHTVHGIKVLVEGGIVLRGVENNRPVYVYRYDGKGGWDREYAATLAAVRAGLQRDTIRLM